RPVYDIHDGSPHLRVENRVLPAGPTVVDTIANAAFFAGLVRALADEDRPIWTQMSFQAANENFSSGIRSGINADVYWPRIGQVKVAELVVRRLLPMAADGLRVWGVADDEAGRLLDIIEQRCLRAANGATWQAAEVGRRERAGDSRADALRGMLRSYLVRMHSNVPVHEWEAG
ncbi:MAG: glutamate--cysteine ligase, partial [Microlunatus sp.]|nr:glutamate--cysteine ligase [Microlunatus sp.]